MSKRASILLTGVAALLLGGCAVSMPGTPEPTAAATDTPGYRAGYQDGCATAHGEYKKNSELFQNDKNYYDGWFAGRSACQYR